MRVVLSLTALALLTAPAYAQTAPPAAASAAAALSAWSAAPPAASPVVASGASGGASSGASVGAPSPLSASATHHRLSMDARFAKANTTNDGHLTLAQAKAGYPTVARHFTEIDTAKNGYVTEDDIRAFDKAARDKRHQAQQSGTPPTKG
jgi:hypothetical protein